MTQRPQSAHPPSVDKLARSIATTGLPHPICVEVARDAINSGRVGIISELAQQRSRQMLTPVINATGVLLHTNLGRAPAATASSESTQAWKASNLELSLLDGKRGSRQHAVGDLIATACGAEAAIVLNNCAGAVLLVLAALSSGRGTVVSRGELVEIGGGFRIPDVMEQSGAKLIEVGTTNRTRLRDYQDAVADNDIAIAMQIHQSNYKIVGFTESVSIQDLATLDVPVVADIGSGLLDAATPWLSGPPPKWLADEPAAKQTLEAGASLVLFSGDKLFGGPQAGIIAGDAKLVAACASHPLARALRPGGLVLDALQQTTLAYLNRAGAEIPFWKMATASLSELRRRADSICDSLPAESATKCMVIETEAVPGGGTLPEVTMPSIGIEVDAQVVDALRGLALPIVARLTARKTTVLDLIAVDPDHDTVVCAALSNVCSAANA